MNYFRLTNFSVLFLKWFVLNLTFWSDNSVTFPQNTEITGSVEYSNSNYFYERHPEAALPYSFQTAEL